MNYPNGMMTEYTYNYAGQIATLTNKLASSLSQNSYNYTYDLAGNIKTKKEMNMAETNTRTYTYDSQNRLTYEGSSSGGDFWYYTYDQYNNLTSAIGRGDKYYTYDANNRLTKLQDQWTEKKLPDGNSVWADWTISYTYDKNGTLKSESRIADTNNGIITNAGTKIYTYNDRGQMTGYSDNTGESATYTYHSDGLRASKTTGSDTIRYYYNGQDVINETKNNTNYATNVMGVDGFISRTQDGTTGYLFHDAHGDITAAYGTSKNKLADYTYDAWGIQTASNNSTWSQANPIRYNGQYYDTESGMTYLRARYYNSEIQRFITEDPIKDGLNWYSYCSNNPVMRTDPTGQNWITDQMKAAWDGAKWAFNQVGNYANELQKKAQRKFWATGSQLLLREKMGCETSAWLLEHSLQDHPDDVYRDNDSRIAYLINTDDNFSNEINSVIANSNGVNFNRQIGVTFSTGDLYYSIHKSTISISGQKREDGSWIIHCVLNDTYDFTEIQSFMSDNGEFSMDASLGTAANDAAYISQKTGAINSYNITVDFWITR